MTTIKMCTDIPQSKKLVKILPIKSADMYYEKVCNLPKIITGNYSLHIQCRASDKDYKKLTNPVLSPCWSLSALLNVLPKIEHLKPFIDLSPELDSDKVAIYYHSEDSPYIVRDNLIDACYEMILKLNELNLL